MVSMGAYLRPRHQGCGVVVVWLHALGRDGCSASMSRHFALGKVPPVPSGVEAWCMLSDENYFSQQTFPAFYGIRKSITAVTSALRMSLS
jgi:hypothetical protein